ncbi:MAG: two-component system, cell cycle sensor histidine kinase and response regulator CckA [Actinomycetota bacterium]|jgi:PAS domain S-box-containing protein
MERHTTEGPEVAADAGHHAATADELRLSEVLSDFARTMVTDFPIQAILHRLVERIVDVLPVDAAGVTLIAPEGRPRYVAGSSDAAHLYQRLQSELGEGPCLTAYETGASIAVTDLRGETPFPTFSAAALDAGLAAVFSFPMRHGPEQMGALDLYRDVPGPLDTAATRAATILADVAAACVLNARTRDDLQDSADRSARLAAIVESSQDSIISWTTGSVITSWNPGSERMYGYDAEEALGQDLSFIVPQEHLATTNRVHSEVLRGLTVPPFETKRRRRDGSVIDVAVTVSPIRDRTGAIIGLSAFGRNISESKRALEALRNSQARKAAVLASALDAIITMDADGRIEEFNPAAERSFGLTADEAVGRNLTELIIVPPADQRLLDLQVCSPDDTGLRTEVVARRSDGTEFPAEVSITVVDAGATLYIAFIRDITEQQQASAKARVLEDRVNQSRRLAGLGQLAGGVAHDFNNLLVVILNYASFVAEAVVDDVELHHDVQQIMGATQRAVRLTRQLLMFASREAADPAPIDLNILVADIEDLLARSIGESNTLVVRPGRDLPAFRADKGHVEQVLLNLALNGRDAMPAGGVLTIETGQVELGEVYAASHPPIRAGRYVQLCVSDNGIGMSPDVASHALEPFFTTKPSSEGTGLGLATVYGIVTESGGGVALYSEEGIGTTAKVFFPIIEDPAAPAPGPATEGPLRGEGETVLVVEDQDAVRAVTVRILRRNGYVVMDASSGADALVIAAEHGLDLLLTDVVMPVMSGPQLAAELRHRDPSLPVLYMSGYAQGVLDLDHGRAESVTLLEKPFDEVTILRRVHQAIGLGPPPTIAAS